MKRLLIRAKKQIYSNEKYNRMCFPWIQTVTGVIKVDATLLTFSTRRFFMNTYPHTYTTKVGRIDSPLAAAHHPTE